MAAKPFATQEKSRAKRCDDYCSDCYWITYSINTIAYKLLHTADSNAFVQIRNPDLGRAESRLAQQGGADHMPRLDDSEDSSYAFRERFRPETASGWQMARWATDCKIAA